MGPGLNVLGRQCADGQGGLRRGAGLLEDGLGGFADVVIDGIAVANARCRAIARLSRSWPGDQLAGR